MISNNIAYGKTLIALAKERDNIIILDADACKSTGTLQVLEAVPERFVQCGIAEQNMMGIAAGLAMTGKVPFAATFAVFTCMRALEQVRNAACYANVPVKVVGTHAGLETGADGGTHQATEDIAIMRSLANMKVVIPASPNSTCKLTYAIADEPGPCYMRLGKDQAPELYPEDEPFPIGGSKQLLDGTDATIIACGNMVWRAMEAARSLAVDGIHVRVIDMYSIKPIDTAVIMRAARETGGLLTVEDHNIYGGLGGAVAEVLTEQAPARLVRMGLPDVFGRSGKPEKLYEMFHLTPVDIAQKVKEAYVKVK